MKILYLIKRKPDETLKKIIKEHEKSNEVTIVNLKQDKNYDTIIDLTVSSDKIICW